MHPSSRLAGLTELSGVRMLWFSGWYDGPVTGLAQHDDRECWFVMVTDDGGDQWDFDPRVYVLHELPQAEIAREWEAHRAFARAGLPGCLHTPPCPVSGDGSELAGLYERWPEDHEDAYTELPARGWFRA